MKCQSINQSVSQSVSQSIDRSIDKSINQSINQSANPHQCHTRNLPENCPLHLLAFCRLGPEEIAGTAAIFLSLGQPDKYEKTWDVISRRLHERLSVCNTFYSTGTTSGFHGNWLRPRNDSRSPVTTLVGGGDDPCSYQPLNPFTPRRDLS